MDEQFLQYYMQLLNQQGRNPNSSYEDGQRYPQFNMWGQNLQSTPPSGILTNSIDVNALNPTAYVPNSSDGVAINPNDMSQEGNVDMYNTLDFRNRQYQNYRYNTATNNYNDEGDVIYQNQNPQFYQQQNRNPLDLFSPVSTETGAFKLGQSLAFDGTNATRGQRTANTFRGIGAAGKTLTSLLRTGFAGAAFQNRQDEALNDYRRRQGQQDYVYLEDGGNILPQEKYLTESYLGEIQQGQIQTAEIEHGEYVQYPNGNVKEAVGNTHEKGGILADLPADTRVISDNLTVGGKTAKELKKTFDISIKANHTFADAIDKYKKKIGLQKLDDEQEGWFKKLEKQEDVKDDQTGDINETFLAKQIKETEAAKIPLKEQLTAFTDMIFQKQEQQKGNGVTQINENGQMYAQNGGIQIDNPYALPDYGFQSATVPNQYYGDVTANNYTTRVQKLAELHPEIATQYFDGTELKKGKTWADFQVAINRKYEAIKKDAKTLLKDNPEAYNQYAQKIDEQKFLEDSDGVRSVDSKIGNYTSSRPTFALNVIPKEELDKLQKEGVFHSSQLRTKNPELYKKYVGDKGLESDFYLGAIDTPTQTDATTTEQKQTAWNIPKGNIVQGGYLNLIDQSMPPPTALQASRMPDSQYRPYEIAQQGYEPQIQNLYNQESAAQAQLQGLSPGQRAAAIAQIAANTQGAANQVIGSVNNANQQEVSKIQNANTDLFNRYSAVDEQERERFEQKTYAAMNATEAGLNNWYQYNNQVNALNQQQRLQANTLQNLFPNVSFDPNGVVGSNGVNSQSNVPIYTGYVAPPVKKKTKK